MPIKLSIQGATATVGTLKTLPGIEPRVIQLLSQAAYDDAQRGAGRHNRTGALLQSLYNRQHFAAGANGTARAVGHDPNRAPHALYVNLGTVPHKIRPKDKRALRWASGGKFRFAKVVNHPGYRGDAYIINAATVALRQFTAIVDRAISEIR